MKNSGKDSDLYITTLQDYQTWLEIKYSET